LKYKWNKENVINLLIKKKELVHLTKQANHQSTYPVAVIILLIFQKEEEVFNLITPKSNQDLVERRQMLLIMLINSISFVQIIIKNIKI